MKKQCANCGESEYNGRCVNCHEVLYILDQYIEQDMDLPSNDSDFMRQVRKCQNELASRGYL